jgi:cytochrome-b5 reductase
VGQHVSLAADIGGRRVVRSYTPTSLDSELGYFDLVVKTYDNGLMSSHLDHLPIGAEIEVRGPKGQFNYTPTLARHLLLVAGGSGITPMYRIIKSAALDATDRTKMCLVFANIAEEDIRESRLTAGRAALRNG